MTDMENAFTQKPNISKFIKDMKQSHLASKVSQAMVQNPSPEQRYFMEINERAPSHDASTDRPPSRSKEPVEADRPPVHGTAAGVPARRKQKGGV
jgi:hypothetical protein